MRDQVREREAMKTTFDRDGERRRRQLRANVLAVHSANATPDRPDAWAIGWPVWHCILVGVVLVGVGVALAMWGP